MGTTSDKLSYLSTTKNYIKESINLTNINITNEPFRYYAYAIKKGIINVLNNPKEIWNNFEKVTGEGTSIELTSTENAPIDINLKGNTSQSGTPIPTSPIPVSVVSGDNEIKVCNKNLFDKNSEDVGYVYSSTGSYSVSALWNTSDWISVESNSQYTLSFKPTGTSNLFFSEFDKNKTFIQRTSTSPITPQSNTKYVRLSYKNDLGIYDIQLEKGNQATSYVEHKEYTKEINLPVENLFDKNSVVGGFVNADGTVGGDVNAYKTSDFIPIQPNTAYYKTRTDSPRTKYYDSNKQPLNTTTYQDISIGGNEGTFTTPNNACYLRFSYPLASVEPNNIMVHKGSKANHYWAYGTTPIEVCSIGEYEDEFFKNTTDSEYYDSTLELDKWYLKKRIGKVVFDGSESYWAKSGVSNENVFVGAYNLHTSGTKTKYGTGSKWLVNRFTYGALGDVDKFNTYNGNAEAGYMFIGLAISTSLANDLATFKNWLSANNVEVHYVLATPENILLNYTLQETLDSFYSYQGQTNISQTNNDLPFILDVKALKLIE